MPHEFNFYRPGTMPEDMELFLGPIDRAVDGPFVPLQPGWILAHVMQAAGAFKSVGDARRNGWDRPVPDGYSEYTVGKRRLRVYVLNLPEGF